MTKARVNADNASADIQGVTAGTGLTGGGTSGTVTLTNDMATAIAAKGDLVAGTANDTYAALTVGSNGTVLTADSTTATGIKWAAAPSSNLDLALITSGTLTNGASLLSLTSLSSYDTLEFVASSVNPAAATDWLRFYTNANTSTNGWSGAGLITQNASAGFNANNTGPWSTVSTWLELNGNSSTGSTNTGVLQSVTPGFPNPNQFRIRLTNCKATGMTLYDYNGYCVSGNQAGAEPVITSSGIITSEAAISSIHFWSAAQTFYGSGGSYALYGA